jgi:two-component system sensor histidine kinase RegB
MRRATAALELLFLAATWMLPRLDLPLDHIAGLLFVDAVANTAVASWLSRGRTVSRATAALALAVQILLLTALLELTGGPSNPFVVVYALQLALAALTLGARWTTLVGAFTAASYGVLIYWHVREMVPTHHRLNDFPTHLFTIWIAGTVAADLIAYFVVQASDALLRREHELEAMRLRAARSERIVSVTTLAAGAAHELSTPLATIALAAKELARALEARAGVTDLAGDARLIRSEVDRCQTILDQMSGRAGGATADEPELVAIPELLENVRARLAPGLSSRLVVHAPADLRPISVPRAGLSQALLSLVKNAFDATPHGETPVVMHVVDAGEMFRVSIEDRGQGMTAEGLQRAGDPFYTTKAPGRGMGLGLFLARIFAERLGGSLRLESGAGTRAVLELPMSSAAVQPT